MCLYPKLIKNPKYQENKKNGGVIPPIFDTRVLAVPIGCGQCMECRKKKKNEWSVRMKEEIKHDKTGIFVTLTFSNESYKELAKEAQYKKVRIQDGIKKEWIDKNGRVQKRYKYKEEATTKLTGYDLDNAIATLAVRKFTGRWIKKHKKSIKHWLVTELGGNGTENIHMHGIIFTDKGGKEINDIWEYGYTWVGNKKENGQTENYVTEKTINYIIKYIHKVDEKHRLFTPKILTSAGIGAGYMKRTDKERNVFKGKETKQTYKSGTGHETDLPLYYKNKIWTDEEKEQLWLYKLDEQVRYVGGRRIDISKGEEAYYKAREAQRIINRKWGFGGDNTNKEDEAYELMRRELLQSKRLK